MKFANRYKHVTPNFLEDVATLIDKIDETKQHSIFARLLEDDDYEDYLFETHGNQLADRILGLDLCLILSEQMLIQIAKAKLGKDDVKFNASISLLHYLLEQSGVIKSLVYMGKDLQARVLARSLAEASDLLMAVNLSDEIAKEFVDAQDAQSTRDFWFRWQSKGKLSKLLSTQANFMDDKVRESWLSQREYINQEYRAFSMASHPTYIAGVMAITMLITPDGLGPYSDENPLTVARVLDFTIGSQISSQVMCASVCAKLVDVDEDREDSFSLSKSTLQKFLGILIEVDRHTGRLREVI